MENFLDIEHSDDRLKHIKVALVMADCSKSAVANPVNFIVSEGEGKILIDPGFVGQIYYYVDQRIRSPFIELKEKHV